MISPADARAVATLLAGVGEVTRMRVLVALSAGPAAVGAVAEMVGVPLVNASHHLNVLRRAGVLVAAKQGRHVIYSFDAGAYTPTSGAAGALAAGGWRLVFGPAG